MRGRPPSSCPGPPGSPSQRRTPQSHQRSQCSSCNTDKSIVRRLKPGLKLSVLKGPSNEKSLNWILVKKASFMLFLTMNLLTGLEFRKTPDFIVRNLLYVSTIHSANVVK